MNRRQFINTALLGCSVPLSGLLQHTFASQLPQTRRRLVLVELAGANDGLNTLVPYTDDIYYRLRPSIGLSKNSLITLDSSLGINEDLRALMPHWERGELAWVQGLGYPKPNRSHFKSIDLWERAGDGVAMPSKAGWITHAIEHTMARSSIDPHGISLSGSLSLFASDSGRWLSAESVNALLQEMPPTKAMGAADHPALAIVQQRLQTLDTTLGSLHDKFTALDKRAEPIASFTGGQFGEQLRQVCKMIAAGLDTPVYRVRLTGFDTHKNQKARHPRLLKTLAAGLSSFAREMRKMQEWNNTLVMSYSEFGRRAGENHSGGTDHGTAAPHFLLGGSVAGGLYGQAPDLSNLIDGDPSFTMDYRALYERVLSEGLQVNSDANTLREFNDNRLKGLIA